MIPFTMRDGRLELDEGHGRSDGPRIVDPGAGRIRFANEQDDIPISALRAVAVVFSERRVRVPSSHGSVIEPRMVHSVVLVPCRPAADVGVLLDFLESGAAPPPGFSVYGAAASVAEASVQVLMGGGARNARAAAKAIARTAGLPMLELYGELPVWRPGDRLDLSLRDRLRAGPPPPDPGPPPPGLTVGRGERGLEIRHAPALAPGSGKRWMLLAAGIAAAAVGLLFLAPPAGIALLALAALPLVHGLRRRRPPGGRVLGVAPDAVRWAGEGQEDAVATEALEMMRVVDSTLVLVARDDELRCELGSPEAAVWARAAIAHHLMRPTAVPEP
jgi:hypothetical protein